MLLEFMSNPSTPLKMVCLMLEVLENHGIMESLLFMGDGLSVNHVENHPGCNCYLSYSVICDIDSITFEFMGCKRQVTKFEPRLRNAAAEFKESSVFCTRRIETYLENC